VSERKVLVFREQDGTWSVIRGSFATEEFEMEDWISEGHGSWSHAMRSACDAVGLRWRR